MTRLTPWNPVRGLAELGFGPSWSDMLERFFPAIAESDGESRWLVKMDAKETPEAYIFTVEAPGLKAEDIDVSVTGDVLRISGEKRREEKREKEEWRLVERSYGAFHRTSTFPVPVDSENIDAELKDGILTVTVMKSKKALPKKVKIAKH